METENVAAPATTTTDAFVPPSISSDTDTPTVTTTRRLVKPKSKPQIALVPQTMPRTNKPLLNAVIIDPRIGFVLSLCVILLLTSLTVWCHHFWLSKESFQFWNMTATHVATPRTWETYDGSKATSVPPMALFLYRLFCASVVLWTTAIIVSSPEGLSIKVTLDQQVTVYGLKRLSTFSMISWNFEGVYFVCAAFCHLRYLASPMLARVAWVFFEISCTISLLVFVIVRAVLIPAARRANLVKTVKQLNSWLPWTVHNVNVTMMIGE